MAHIYADNIREGSSTEGFGNLALEGGVTTPGGVVVGRRFNEVLADGDTFDYTIFHTNLNEWEIGVGVYHMGDTISRNPSSSSNNGSLVDFSFGPKQVFIAPVAASMIDLIDGSRLPSTQTGKTFTSTVTVTGDTGLRVIYGEQSYSLGGLVSDISDIANVLNSTASWTTWYIDKDKFSEGFRIREHTSGSNARNIISLPFEGTPHYFSAPIKTVWTGGSQTETDFVVGHTILVYHDGVGYHVSRNHDAVPCLHTGSQTAYVLEGGPNAGAALSGIWRSRGRIDTAGTYMLERVS